MEKLEILVKDEVQLKISIDKNAFVESKSIATHPNYETKLASIQPDKIDIWKFNEWLKSRIPNQTYFGINYILSKYHLDSFVPYQVCKKSHGRRLVDDLWIRWENEKLTYADVASEGL